MRFRVEPRDIPAEHAARRLGMTVAKFGEVRDNLIARGFPKPDPDTGNFDSVAIDRWCDTRHPHLFASREPMTARDSRMVAPDRIEAMKAKARGQG